MHYILVHDLPQLMCDPFIDSNNKNNNNKYIGETRDTLFCYIAQSTFFFM